MLFFFFFFNDTATTEIYTLSLHDALPISNGHSRPHLLWRCRSADYSAGAVARQRTRDRKSTRLNSSHDQISYAVFCLKTEEHTSELQSRSDLVCRLLLEKKKEHVNNTFSD